MNPLVQSLVGRDAELDVPGRVLDELRIRPKRRLLRNAPRRFRIQLLVEATDAAGNTRRVRRTIRVRR